MGQTPLHVAAANGCLRGAKVLVKRGASPAALDGPLTDGMNPSQVAAMWGFTEVATFLNEALIDMRHRISVASKLHRSVA